MKKISLINLCVLTFGVTAHLLTAKEPNFILIAILMSLSLLIQTIYQFKLDIEVNRSKYTSVNIKSANKRRG